MTPGDVTALVELGETLYGGADMINLIGNCVMYGLYALSFFTALYMFCSKPLKGPTHRALLALLIIVFFSLTGDFIDRNGSHLLFISFALVHPIPNTIQDLSISIDAASDRDVPWQAIQFWGPTINLCIGDGLVLWRAWVVLDLRQKGKRYLLAFVLMLLMVGNIGVNVVDAIYDDIGLDIQLADGAITLDWVSLVVSLVVNAFATTLIGLKAWGLHRQSKGIHHLQTQQSPVKKVLLILVESGLGFCMIQVEVPFCHLC
ncbi:hypothetical protein BT96DRAFT_441154 [Gymnopus androsaceus JB14]|uniref:Uncharacterized protein n=1 Tax=Gymnopus androsaceus JB14 TaxID=1447944 RepID=A0A6A4I2K3_9AGAR|nr:hypothetical protein BT96DRAFT_441154 [Gymnopus androsaceus JB14]